MNYTSIKVGDLVKRWDWPMGGLFEPHERCLGLALKRTQCGASNWIEVLWSDGEINAWDESTLVKVSTNER